MLAYQHAYHAGNFADVHKHLTLFAVTRLLSRKRSPITYVDTHAGRGSYPLAADETQKLMEYRSGILPLWQARSGLAGDSLLTDWLARLATLQHAEALTHYPGSPWWLADALRGQDCLSLFELHPAEHRYLEDQALPANARRIHGDGLAGLVHMLPVSTPRLCVLIDPSYERKEEYLDVADILQKVVRKVRHAVVLVWYPLLPAGRHRSMLERIRDQGLRKLWQAEVSIGAPSDTHGIYGSGMLVLNPPWGLEEALESAMAQVVPLLGGSARYRSGWWVGE